MLLSQWLGILILTTLFVVCFYFFGKYVGYGTLTVGILVGLVVVVILFVGIALALGIPIIPGIL
jgi:uncharacterized oligopeptide transporter (OPT) family protein